MSHWMTSGAARLKARQNRSFAARAQQRARVTYGASAMDGNGRNSNSGQSDGSRRLYGNGGKYVRRRRISSGIVSVDDLKPNNNTGPFSQQINVPSKREWRPQASTRRRIRGDTSTLSTAKSSKAPPPFAHRSNPSRYSDRQTDYTYNSTTSHSHLPETNQPPNGIKRFLRYPNMSAQPAVPPGPYEESTFHPFMEPPPDRPFVQQTPFAQAAARPGPYEETTFDPFMEPPSAHLFAQPPFSQAPDFGTDPEYTSFVQQVAGMRRPKIGCAYDASTREIAADEQWHNDSPPIRGVIEFFNNTGSLPSEQPARKRRGFAPNPRDAFLNQSDAVSSLSSTSRKRKDPGMVDQNEWDSWGITDTVENSHGAKRAKRSPGGIPMFQKNRVRPTDNTPNKPSMPCQDANAQATWKGHDAGMQTQNVRSHQPIHEPTEVTCRHPFAARQDQPPAIRYFNNGEEVDMNGVPLTISVERSMDDGAQAITSENPFARNEDDYDHSFEKAGENAVDASGHFDSNGETAEHHQGENQTAVHQQGENSTNSASAMRDNQDPLWEQPMPSRTHVPEREGADMSEPIVKRSAGRRKWSIPDVRGPHADLLVELFGT